MAVELKTLIDSNTVRVLDLVRLTKAHDGAVEASELRDADDSEIGETLEPRSAAAVLVQEHTRAAPVGSAVRTSGGELLGNDRIGACARRRSRPGPPGRGHRSMTMPPTDRGDSPRLIGGGHERRDACRDDRGNRRGERRDDRQDRRPGPGTAGSIARGRAQP